MPEHGIGLDGLGNEMMAQLLGKHLHDGPRRLLRANVLIDVDFLGLGIEHGRLGFPSVRVVLPHDFEERFRVHEK